MPAEALTQETFASLYKDFFFSFDTAKKVYNVSKRVNGRVMISNYDPSVLSNEERLRLHAEAEEAPVNDVVFDIRAGHTGGEYPMHGRLRLRSFHEILTFIGRGIEEEPEIDVAPDPRTPTIAENPVQTLAIAEQEGIQPPVSAVPDEPVGRQGHRPGDHDFEVNGPQKATGQATTV